MSTTASAPGETTRRALSLAGQLSAASVTGGLLVFPARVAAHAALGPAGLGVLKIAELVQKASAYLDGGMKYSFARQLPIRLERRETIGIERMSAAALTWTIGVAGTVVGALWIAWLAGFTFRGLLTPINLVFLSGIVLLERVTTFLHGSAKGSGVFSAIGATAVVTQLVAPLLLLGGVLLAGVSGALAAQVLVGILVALTYANRLARAGHLRLHLAWEGAETRALLVLGLLLYATALSEGLIELSAGSLLAFYVPVDQIGQFAYATTMVLFTTNVTAGVNAVVARRMLQERGRQGELVDYAPFRRFLEEGLVLYMLLVTCAMFFTYFGHEVIVRLFLPRFAPAVPLAQLLGAAQVMCALTYLFRTYFNATDQIASRLWLVWSGLPLGVGVTLMLLQLGYGAVGAAAGVTIGYFIYASALVLLSARQVLPGGLPQGWRLLLRLHLVTLGAVIVLRTLTFVQLPEWPTIGWLGTLVIELAGAGIRLLLAAGIIVVAYALLFARYRPAAEVLALGRFGIVRLRELLGGRGEEAPAAP